MFQFLYLISFIYFNITCLGEDSTNRWFQVVYYSCLGRAGSSFLSRGGATNLDSTIPNLFFNQIFFFLSFFLSSFFPFLRGFQPLEPPLGSALAWHAYNISFLYTMYKHIYTIMVSVRCGTNSILAQVLGYSINLFIISHLRLLLC